MKSLKLSVIAALMFTLGACKSAEEYVEIPAEVMDDKVKGAWAGKMIGVMYGRPMEFVSNSDIYRDSIKWDPKNIEAALLEDDI